MGVAGPQRGSCGLHSAVPSTGTRGMSNGALKGEVVKKLLVTAMAAVTLVLAGSATAVADDPATAPPLTSGEEQSVRAFLTQYAVPAATQDALIAEIQAGGAWDSMDPAAVPTARRTTSAGGTLQTVATFADGSVLVTDAPAPKPTRPGGIAPMNFGQCVVVSSSSYHVTYENCFVSANNGVSRASFRAGYSKFSGAPAKIDYVEAGQVECYVCNISGVNLRITRTQATSTRPATARMDWQFSLPPWGVPSGTAWIEMRVTSGGTVSTPNDIAPWSS